FMFVWLTSAASPINFPGRANIGTLVSHLEVILVAVIPLALLGLVQSMRGDARTKSSAFAERLAIRASTYRKAHSGKYTYRKAEIKSQIISIRTPTAEEKGRAYAKRRNQEG